MIRRPPAFRPRIVLHASVAVLVGSIACGDGPIAPACGSSSVDVQVSASFPPLVTWTPDCSVERLAFRSPDPGDYGFQWTIAAGDRRIESGVRYGQLPRGAVEEQPGTGVLPSGMIFNVVLESPRGTTVGVGSWVVP